MTTFADKPRRVALYLRVSTGEQTTENQAIALQAEALRRGWIVTATYEDAGISGAKGRDKRPGLHQCLQDATRGRYDVLMAWAVDRLGRSLPDLVGTLQELNAAHVDLYLHVQALDTSTPAGRAMFHMLGVFAEFERSMIQARIMQGLARARKAGTRLGRKRTPYGEVRKVLAALAAGQGVNETARSLGLASGTVRRIRDDNASVAVVAAE
jgi:DNA invertase Pin-like site-specific DNA recombinase